jgi:zinc protease
VTSTLARGLSPVRSVLANGAVVLVQETSTTPAVAINASFLAGSIYEPEALTGLSHLMARVVDRGTERRPGEVIAEELDERGVSLRVGTSRHVMTFSCTCLAQDFDEVLDIVLDIARRPIFPEAEIAKRRAEVVTALRQDADNPGVVAVESLMALLYGEHHPYGRPSKGSPETIERIDRDAMAAFHARHVQPGVLSLAVVGDVRADDVLAAVGRQIEDWPSRPAAPVLVVPPSPGVARRHRVMPMPGKSQTDIAYGFTSIRRLDPRYYAYWMMNNVLGQFGLGGRLADNIRERQGMAYYAFSSFEGTVGESPLVVRAGVDPLNVDRAIEAIDFEVGALAAKGPTKVEVEETRAFLIGSIPRMFETNYAIATFLQGAEQFGLGLDIDQRLPALLEAVTEEEIAAAAADVLRPEQATVVVAGPQEASS